MNKGWVYLVSASPGDPEPSLETIGAPAVLIMHNIPLSEPKPEALPLESNRELAG